MLRTTSPWKPVANDLEPHWSVVRDFLIALLGGPDAAGVPGFDDVYRAVYWFAAARHHDAEGFVERLAGFVRSLGRPLTTDEVARIREVLCYFERKHGFSLSSYLAFVSRGDPLEQTPSLSPFGRPGEGTTRGDTVIPSHEDVIDVSGQ